MAPGVCVRKGQMLLKLDLYHRCGLNKTFAASFHQLLQKQQQFQLYNNHHQQQQSVHRQNRRHGQPTTAFGIVVATTVSAKANLLLINLSFLSHDGKQENLGNVEDLELVKLCTFIKML